jgi:hypothetical protein
LLCATAAPAAVAVLDVQTILAKVRQAALGRSATPAGLSLKGEKVEAQNASPTDEMLDLRSGRFRSESRDGPLIASNGYDRAAWAARAGIVSLVDLPPLAADARTDAFVRTQAWLSDHVAARYRLVGRRTEAGRSFLVVRAVPAGGAPVELWFDARTLLLARTILKGEFGDKSRTYDDYRPVGGLRWPFHSVTVDATKSRTELRWDRAEGTARPDVRRPAPAALRTITRPVTVPLSTDGVGDVSHIVVPARIAGQPVNFFFDTGGSNIMSRDAAARLRLAASGGVNVGGSGASRVEARVADVSAIEVGGIALRDQQFLVLPLPLHFARPRAGLEVDGLVGFEWLALCRIAIDYQALRMTLSPFAASPVPGAALPFTSDGEHPFVRARVDGVEGWFAIDTGDTGGVTIFQNFARQHHLFARGGSETRGSGLGGEDRERTLRARSFTIAGTTIADPIVSVPAATAGDFAGRSIAGNIGAGILSRFTLTIDSRAHTITFRPNSRLHAPFRSNHFGLTARQNGQGSFEIAAVAAGSPAATAGLTVGERIVSADGRAGDTLGLMDMIALLDREAPLALEIRPKDGPTRTVRLAPADLIGPPQ